MTDFEITKLCAEAMDLKLYYVLSPQVPMIRHLSWYDRDSSDSEGPLKLYNPLHDDVQAVALVKKCGLDITAPHQYTQMWQVSYGDSIGVYNLNLNRAICECVTKMQILKQAPNRGE